MSRRVRPSLLLALVALIAAVCVGCGSSAPSETADHGGSSADGQEQAVKFAECMRQNGVSDFPDPDAKGEFEYGVSVSPSAFKAATDACKDLEPPGVFSSKRDSEEQDAALKFAACIRENGVKDFPDPVDGEPLVDTTKIPSTDQPGGMDVLNSAMAKCGDLVEKAAAGQ